MWFFNTSFTFCIMTFGTASGLMTVRYFGELTRDEVQKIKNLIIQRVFNPISNPKIISYRTI
jgi:hypothetical protein